MTAAHVVRFPSRNVLRFSSLRAKELRTVALQLLAEDGRPALAHFLTTQAQVMADLASTQLTAKQKRELLAILQKALED
jgi:hypothetical protein